MPEYSQVLGDVVKVTRERAGLTQAEVAASIGRDSRTVLNIENYKGNPKVIIANTTKGYGSPVMENKADWHHHVPTAEEYDQIQADFAAGKEAARHAQ